MNKKLLALSIAVLAVTALFAGNQTIKSLNKESSQAASSTVNEADNITTVALDSSEILRQESEIKAPPAAQAENKSPSVAKKQPEQKKISVADAEAIALKKAGFSADEVYDKEVELNYEKNVLVYEVSFEKDRVDYDYVIDAASGEVLHSKVDPEGNNKSKVPSEAVNSEVSKPSAQAKNDKPENRISAKEAEEIALKKAGFSESEVYDKEVELDYERGAWVYEVSFEKDRVDYDYVINAVNGEIVHSQKEAD